jgi:hypothetical protein
LLDLAIGGYTKEQVRRALHYNASRRISFRYELLGPKNIYKAPLEVLPGGEISLDASGSIKRTGGFVVKDNGLINWQTDRIKPYFVITIRKGKTIEWPLGVFYMPTAIKSKSAGGTWYEVEAYDLCAALQDDSDSTKTFFPAGTLYVDAVSTLLTSAGIGYAIITNSAQALAVDREWDLGTPKLEIAQTLLKEINYNDLYVDGNGVFIVEPYINPLDRPAEYEYLNDAFSVLYPGASSQQDSFYLPNVVIGVVSTPDVGELVHVYENTDPGNPLSIPARDGRRVVQKIDFEGIASQGELQAATIRKAQELTEIYEITEFETALMPHHAYNDLLYLSNSVAQGRYLELGWSMALKAGEKMTHKARRLVV